MMRSRPSGTALPWAAFALGAAGSLAANLLDAVAAVHSVANGDPVGWADLSAALFFAALTPTALLLVVEMLIRSGKERDGLTAVMWVGAAVVATGAAVMSFGHMYKVMSGLGQPTLFAALMPLAVDGLMLVASVALARAGRASVPEALPKQENVPPVTVDLAAKPAEEVPVEVPKPAEEVPTIRNAGDATEAAREFIRHAMEEGRKVTGTDVAASVAAYGKRSDRWGRLRIADVKAELSANDRLPVNA